MLRKWIHTAFLLGCMAVSGLAAQGQTDVAVSVYGAFSGKTDGNGVEQSPSNAAGGIVELRHIRNPLIGYEATYSFNRANQSYSSDPLPGACPTSGCGGALPPVHIPANAHEITADWVASLHVANLRPFALAGGGLLLDVPQSGSNTSTDTKGVFVYGGGLDWGVLPHLGLRFQYRGNLYKAPNLTRLFTSTDRFTHTAEPMIGAYFRF